LLKYFYSGNYKKFLELLPASLDNKKIPLHLILASHIFLGDLTIAKKLFSKNETLISEDDRAICLFYLTIGSIRIGKLIEGRLYIKSILKLLATNKKNRVLHFAFFQSLGFLYYFKSRFRKSYFYALRSFQASSFIKDSQIRILAMDLLANCEINIGEIIKGIDHLKQSYKESIKVRNLNYAASIKINILSFECQYGLLKKPLPTLYKNLQKLNPQNTFSRNLIWLAYLGQLISEGRLAQFDSSYQKAQAEILKSSHIRHHLLLRFKYAYSEFLKFNYENCLLELASIEESLSKKNDLTLLSQIYGLRYKIIRHKDKDRAAQILGKLKNWQRQSGSDLALNYLKRIESDLVNSTSQDPLGILINKFYQKNPIAIFSELQKKNRLIHFHDFLNHSKLKTNNVAKVILTGLTKDKALFLHSGNWAWIDSPTSNVTKLINCLSIEPLSKENLVQLIWGYAYDPITHDALLMTLIQRTRKYLQQIKIKINVQNGIYYMAPVVFIESFRAEIIAESPLQKPLQIEKFLSDKNNLSFRQFEILEILSNSNTPLSMDYFLKKFKVSRMSLCRDLSTLKESNLIQPLGNGRGRLYVKN
jgi:hypothetical protein